MKLNVKDKDWWGAPKKFSTTIDDRKISWLELFYDLVYVIAIAKITHLLAEDLSLAGLLTYIYYFAILFWGWLNGSLYHDLHGAEGLRTRIMTLWQILIVAAIVITLNASNENLIFNISIAIMVMQVFITYLWWSVGLYDKNHRKLNKPYSILYLLSLAIMFYALGMENPYKLLVFYIALIINYLPPFIGHKIVKNQTIQINLSSSMTERLGLFTIILFGEIMAGLINGISKLNDLSFLVWADFFIAVLIVFALWWIFFTSISDRKCQDGFIKSSLLEFFYLPTLITLGLIALCFSLIFDSSSHLNPNFLSIKELFGIALSTFLFCINILLQFLIYPPKYMQLKKKAQYINYAAAFLILTLTFLPISISLFYYLLAILGIILSIILLLNYSWYTRFSN